MSKPSPERVKEIFQQAVELPSDRRGPLLDAACAGDGALRRRVEQLLDSLDHAGSFMASPTQTSPAAPASAGSTPLVAGTTLGRRYRILELAGVGGMGEVYRAEDLELGQIVALKLLPEQVSHDASMLERLRHEVRIARQVSHPNVCRVYDIGEAEGRHFLSMEWIDGRDLDSVLRAEGRLPADRANFIARQVCAGLAAAHERNVVHRDLKPANVMLDARGVARITDFGLAEATGAVRGDRAREGTPRYMSPEQLAGGEVGTASDIYALGLLLYELLTGRRGYGGQTLEELTEQRREPPAPPSSLAPEVERKVDKLILRCLEHDPARRPPSARDVLDVLPGGRSYGEASSVAQQRADRIAAFRTEIAELRRAGLVTISEGELRAVEGHHERVLRDLVRTFDVDLTERGKQLSLGMRAVALVGTFALAASAYYFFFRIWGTISTTMQVGILAGAPVAALAATVAVARRERHGYFTLMAALVTFACFVADTSLLGSTFNVTPSPLALLAWGTLALVLAYAYRLRLLLVVGLVMTGVFVAATLLHGSGGLWPQFLMRPEGFLPAGAAIFALALWTHRRGYSEFGPVYCVLGIVFLVAPAVMLGVSGVLSYLPFAHRPIEIVYQLVGFGLSAAAIWIGISRRRKEAVYAGTFFFVVVLFVEFVNWWWDWMPRYLFFLVVAATSVAVVIGLQRLRRTLSVTAEEGAR